MKKNNKSNFLGSGSLKQYAYANELMKGLNTAKEPPKATIIKTRYQGKLPNGK